jgi:hypothetical protein
MKGVNLPIYFTWDNDVISGIYNTYETNLNLKKHDLA